MDNLRSGGYFSDNEVFRYYVDNKGFKVPAEFPEARYVIAMAVYTPLARVNVPHKGRLHSILIPPNYRTDDYTMEQLQATIAKKLIGEDNYRIEDARRNVHLKHLAARSGLARYGRNNICYVDGMGSMLSLYAFFTDYIFDEDHWVDMQIMDSCEDCLSCIKQCPTHSISKDRFVIDVDKCIPLYNEIQGEIPDWVPRNAHSALIGCMHCQLDCPANRDAVAETVDLDDLSESETIAILNEVVNEDSIRALSQKLKVSPVDAVPAYLPVFSRNLKALLGAFGVSI
ncbi:MAG: 4Fe-4S double cluster binding domain-containing protein [Candidatus Thorarchaeota archaeon]